MPSISTDLYMAASGAVANTARAAAFSNDHILIDCRTALLPIAAGADSVVYGGRRDACTCGRAATTVHDENGILPDLTRGGRAVDVQCNRLSRTERRRYGKLNR